MTPNSSIERTCPGKPGHAAQVKRSAASCATARATASYGKPLDLGDGDGDGYDQTPVELRMAMKVLKDAGVVPHEVMLMREAAALQSQIDACTDASLLRALRQQLAVLQQNIALRLERWRVSGSL